LVKSDSTQLKAALTAMTTLNTVQSEDCSSPQCGGCCLQLRNVGNKLPIDKYSYSIRLESSSTPLRDPQLLHYICVIRLFLSNCSPNPDSNRVYAQNPKQNSSTV